MTTTLNFKDIIDLPEWRPLAVSLNAHAAGGSIVEDMRQGEDRHPEIHQLVSATVLNSYNVKNDGWSYVGTPALAGTFGAGASSVFVPGMGPRGSVAAGCTTTTVVISTALPAAVGVNVLANRGSAIQGYKIRIIGNTAGGSGKVEERYIIGNTGGTTTPTIRLDSALSFTPAAGDLYEILSGRVYLLCAGTVAAGIWKYYDICTNSFSGNLSTTNLPASIGTDTALLALDEQYTPLGVSPGGGFFGQLTSTGTAASTITGQASGGDAGVLANEWRNFQIRIVEDTTTPTAVGQRRIITSHTAGASPVYTVNAAWTVTPSSGAKFVIENPNYVLYFGPQTTVYTYNPTPAAINGLAADAWNTTQFGAKGSANGAGVMAFQGFGIPLATDVGKNFRHSQIFVFRGGASGNLDVLDIAAAAAGTWSNAVNYGNTGTMITTGACGAYNPWNNNGRHFYINMNALGHMFRFDIMTRNINSWAQLRYAQGTAAVGARMACSAFIDTNVNVPFVYVLRCAGVEMFSSLVTR